LGNVFAQNAAIAKVFAPNAAQADMTFEFISTLLKILGIIAAVYGIQVVMYLYNEETEGRVEPLLAGSVPRYKLYASHVILALFGPAVALVVSGCVMALVTSAHGVDISAGNIIKQAATDVLAVWVLIGVSVATVGAHPVARFASWLAVIITFALTLFGPMFRLWDWVQGISPLWHVPSVAAADPDWIQLVWLVLALAVFLGAGFKGFAKRDIAAV
jgi:ABC-2 type transport system permease protein